MTMFTDPFGTFDALTRALATPSTAAGRAPRFMPMDVSLKDDTYTLVTDLPGVDPESIEVGIDHGVLTVSAKREAESSEEKGEWITNERFTGSYRRQVTLSDSIDTERVTADYNNGVLTVTLPLADRAKSRKIQVTQAAARKAVTAGATAEN